MIWNSIANTVEEALALPLGELIVDDGFMKFEQEIHPSRVTAIVEEAKKEGISFEATTQAEVFANSQKAGMVKNNIRFLAR